ncbi:MAG: hypothetical protein FWG92_06610 [Leptospirales bacterium]|nr:hypothetical protein [Leptospirales bacterium]
MKRIFFTLLSAVLGISSANAASSLLYFEVQGIAGYSSMDDGMIYHSGHEHDVMQKNSIGFDYIKKFSGEYGDVGTGALQMRLAWDDAKNKPQLQVYNAYLKGKTPFVDIWAGHNRIPFGLASYWDTHAHLLQPLAMYGFGFDRDWGGGISRDFANADFSAAITTGSGMGLKLKGNWLATSRASYGVLSRDNYNFGISFMGGKMLDAMGYRIMHDEPNNIILGGADLSFNHGRVEHKAEFNYGQKKTIRENPHQHHSGHHAEFDSGQKDYKTAAAVFYRIGFNFLEDNRLKLEGEYIWTKQEETSDIKLGAGAAYRITPALAARAMYQWEREMNDNRAIFQLYYYRGIL